MAYGGTVVLLHPHATERSIRKEENYPALTGGWSGCPDGQLGFPGNPAAITRNQGRVGGPPPSASFRPSS
eukprot:1366878-Pyramimonas_sp.AAC.1